MHIVHGMHEKQNWSLMGPQADVCSMGLSDCRMQLLTYLRYIPALPVHKCEKDALVRRQRGPEDSYPSLAGRWGDQVDSTQRESDLTTTLQLLPRWHCPLLLSGLMNRACGWIEPTLFLNEYVYQAAWPSRCWWMEAKQRRDIQRLMRPPIHTSSPHRQPDPMLTALYVRQRKVTDLNRARRLYPWSFWNNIHLKRLLWLLYPNDLIFSASILM